MGNLANDIEAGLLDREKFREALARATSEALGKARRAIRARKPKAKE